MTSNMKRSQRFHALPEDFIEQEDSLVLRGKGFSQGGRGGSNRKALQLCSQVADTLNYVFSGECDDELLRNLHVVNVVPAPNGSQLLVTVAPVVPLGKEYDAGEVNQRLAAAAGRLRSEVASAITRKKTPRLLFVVSAGCALGQA
jgi:ribosome-binding factor A